MTSYPYYNYTFEEVAKKQNVLLDKGLTNEEVEQRLQASGYNEFQKRKKRSLFAKFLDQFKSFMIIILLIAAVVSGITGYLQGEGFADAIIILLIVILNAVIGLVQESKAEESLEALQKLSAPQCEVLRNGVVMTIESRNLVPGDIVLLETGDSVPADLRLIESVNLKIQEAALTGESLPVEKCTDALTGQDIPLGDRANMAFSSGSVVYGRGKGLVVATGMNTEVGKIASMIQSAPEQQTPLQQKLDKLGKHLGIAALIICAIIFAVGVLYGNSLLSMFMIAVSLAAAAIPEGLPAVSTIVLAIGVQKMAKNHAIVRTLPSVETLGSVNVICSDKTGTLTQNRMTVVRMFTDNTISDDVDGLATAGLTEAEQLLMKVAVLANDAKLSLIDEEYQSIGDPTETALVDLGLRFTLNKNALEKTYQRVEELPFDSERKLMSTIHTSDQGRLAVYTKGGLDELLDCCSRIYIKGEVRPLTENDKAIIREANLSLAKEALRVLAMAYKDLERLPDKIDHLTLENELIFVGMMGMIDPPRAEVKQAVLTCRKAGIKPVMITGDHKVTAEAIARQLEIMQEGDMAMVGAEVEKLSDEELYEVVPRVAVYARVSPEIKVRIVKAFQAHGAIVAMTGDGVNDAPALKLANIGVAMGITGTDVSKEAADIILTDDNFSTIVVSVKEGRRIYDNIMKAIEFLLSTNVGELVVLFVAVMANWTTPLLPIHILWINLVTDSLPALALAVDPPAKDIMQREPTNSKKPILNKSFSILVLLQGIMIGALALAAFQIGLRTTPAGSGANPVDVARAMCFSVLAFAQLVHVFNIRSSTRSAFSNMFSNKMLLLAIAASAGLMLMVLEVPYLHDLFHISHLTMKQWLCVLALSIAPLPIIECIKFLERSFSKGGKKSIFHRN